MRKFILLTLGMIRFAFAQELMLAGTYTQQSGKGIYSFSFDEATGTLKQLFLTPATNPSYLAVSHNKKFVYAVSENDNGMGAVNAYRFQNGQLELLNTRSSHGDAPCYIAIDKSDRWVVSANYSGGNFCVYPLDEQGVLGEAAQIIQHNGCSVNKDRQEKAHAHAAVISPDQQFVAVADLGMDKILLYPFHPEADTPIIEKPLEIRAPAGSGPRHIVFHPFRPFAYVIEELSGYVSAYRIKNGKITLLERVNAHAEGFSGEIGSAAIKISPDGKFLYASNRGGANTITCFAIEPSLGKLRRKGIYPTHGEAPRDFAISPSGKYLLAANSKSNTIAIFRRNLTTGKLSESPTLVDLPEPVCLVFVP